MPHHLGRFGQLTGASGVLAECGIPHLSVQTRRATIRNGMFAVAVTVAWQGYACQNAPPRLEVPHMKFGFVLPTGDARTAADFAHAAEQAGWDGFFVWEPVWGIDAWISLAAAAMRTEHIRLGTDLTPLSRMRPWKLASETVTLDHLSHGRVILSVGLGALDTGFECFGEVTDRRTRAELLDEGLEILTGLWEGQPFRYDGRHYRVQETNFMVPPPPAQRPRIPIWVVA